MKGRFFSSIVPALLLVASIDAGETGYYRFPAIHGDTIVFAAEGDLWKVSAAGGLALRLTTHPGDELFTRISPDGEWIAFSGEYQGNRDVFIMPITGGEPRRLTFHPRNDEVIAWRPDSRRIVFRTNRHSFSWSGYNLFEVPVEGGQPRELRIGPAVLADFSPDGKTIAFNRLSREFRNWKRYYGGRAQDIWVGDLEAGTFRRITDWKGTDRFPMFHGDSICFASDRSGTMNIYRMNLDGAEVEPVTRHRDHDVRWPDSHGERIVYMLRGDLWIVDLRSGEDRRVEIEIPSDRVRHQPRFEDAAKTLDHYVLSHDGKRLALSSRGEIWVMPTRKGRRVQLTRSSGIRERAPVFSPDGTKVAFITDRTGEQELAIQETSAKSPPEIVTRRGQGWLFAPVWSPDGGHLAYADLTFSLFVVDTESRESRLVEKNDYWEIREYAFSPDGKWLAYSRREENDFYSIALYSIEEGKSHTVTTPFSSDYSPAWDPEGKYLYFLSDRTYNPLHGELDYQYIVTRASRPYAVILSRDGKSPFLPEELLGEGDDGAAPGDEEGKKDEKRRQPLPEVIVHVEGIQSRVVEFPVPADHYSDLGAAPAKVFFVKRPLRGRMGPFDEKARNSLLVHDLKERKTEVHIERLRDYTLSGDRKRIAHRVEDEIVVSDLSRKPERRGRPDREGDEESDRVERIRPSDLSLRVIPSREWEQIFHEAWRLQRDFYWAANMASVDWKAMREKYRVLLPRISTRNELNDLIGQMFAELGTSHTYVRGGDVLAARRIDTGLLGATVELDPDSGLHRFVKVLRPEVWETDVKAPLTANHVGVREGDYLFAINGQELTREDNIHDHLANLAGQEVQLTVGSDPDSRNARDVQIETLESETQLMLRDWCRRNREYVDKRSSGRFGYVHLPNMSGSGLVEFSRGFYPQIHREGLIIDVRYNGGGNVSQLIIDRLNRKLWAYMMPRRGSMRTYPARVHIGHKVVLTNQNAGSDGDIFPESFQVLGLGPVIGMRSWGGVVGIRMDKPFIDGGMSSQPEFAWWHPARGWGLENRGVEPDIEVDILPEDWRAGRDPQLDRAIAELERRSRESPVAHHPRPPLPDKSKPLAASIPAAGGERDAASSGSPPESPPVKRLLLLGQGPDGHPPSTHEYMAGVRILSRCLEGVEGLETTVLRADEPWEGGPGWIDGADGIVLFLSAGARWIHQDPARLAALKRLAERGGGLAGVHWGIGTREARHVPEFLSLLGGCHGGPDRKFKVVEVTAEIAAADHPILRGVGPFRVEDEFYYRLKFISGGRGITPLIRVPIEAEPHTVAWAWERPGGGRSFGFSGCHFHRNWKIREYRRLVTQAILWVMGFPVPEGGAPVALGADVFRLPE